VESLYEKTLGTAPVAVVYFIKSPNGAKASTLATAVFSGDAIPG
jgi:hypothetical protein